MKKISPHIRHIALLLIFGNSTFGHATAVERKSLLSKFILCQASEEDLSSGAFMNSLEGAMGQGELLDPSRPEQGHLNLKKHNLNGIQLKHVHSLAAMGVMFVESTFNKYSIPAVLASIAKAGRPLMAFKSTPADPTDTGPGSSAMTTD